MPSSRYYGKYRAFVVDVDDPEKRARIKVRCPRVLGESKSAWCEPCVPYAYEQGGDFVLPKVGAFVWVEFEEGDISHPVYTGGLWSKENTPVDDYTKATERRQISFGSFKITFDKETKTLIITNGSAVIRMVEDKIYFN